MTNSFNHVALLTRDSAATYAFYTQILGFRLVSAVREDSVPSTGEKYSFLHTFFALEDGSCMAFFELSGTEIPVIDDMVPKWVKHFAINVGGLDELLAWKQRLESHGIETHGVTDHEGIWQSIYFFDPNGIRLEFTWQARPLTESDRTKGHELLGDWVREHGGRPLPPLTDQQSQPLS